jgi:hypothetical protein
MIMAGRTGIEVLKGIKQIMLLEALGGDREGKPF